MAANRPALPGSCPIPGKPGTPLAAPRPTALPSILSVVSRNDCRRLLSGVCSCSPPSKSWRKKISRLLCSLFFGAEASPPKGCMPPASGARSAIRVARSGIAAPWGPDCAWLADAAPSASSATLSLPGMSGKGALTSGRENCEPKGIPSDGPRVGAGGCPVPVAPGGKISPAPLMASVERWGAAEASPTLAGPASACASGSGRPSAVDMILFFCGNCIRLTPKTIQESFQKQQQGCCKLALFIRRLRHLHAHARHWLAWQPALRCPYFFANARANSATPRHAGRPA